MAAPESISKRLWLLVVGLPIVLVTLIGGAFAEAIRKRLAPQADSILDHALTLLERCLAWGSRREVAWGIAAILLLALVFQAASSRKVKAVQKDEEEGQPEEKSRKEAAAILKEIVGGIRESAEVQRALWTQEKSSLIAHRDDIAKQAKSLEEKVHSLHTDAEQYGEALEFLQWACTVARDQADRYARQHLRTGMEAVKKLATLTAAERAGAAALAIQRMMGILHMGRASRVRVSCL